jgi:hypothetical protein
MTLKTYVCQLVHNLLALGLVRSQYLIGTRIVDTDLLLVELPLNDFFGDILSRVKGGSH